MRRPSPWLVLVVILLGAYIVREPRLQQMEDVFLNWFMEHAEGVLPPAQVTLVEIGRDDFQRLAPPEEAKPLPKGQAARARSRPSSTPFSFRRSWNFSRPSSRSSRS